MKTNTAIALMIAIATLGCKKETEKCGTCNFYSHYSHNDSTFTIKANEQSCGQGYEYARNFNNTYPDSVNHVATTVHEYSICTDQ